jgi:hypothetical protein
MADIEYIEWGLFVDCGALKKKNLTVWKEKFDSLEREFLTVWKGKF